MPEEDLQQRIAELEAALNFDWIPFLHRDDRERVVSAWKKAFENSEEFHLEYRWVHTDGTIVWTLGDVIPIPGDDGKATMFIGTLTDITARKQTEERLKSSLSEKEILLRELYHRTKNTLQLELL